MIRIVNRILIKSLQILTDMQSFQTHARTESRNFNHLEAFRQNDAFKFTASEKGSDVQHLNTFGNNYRLKLFLYCIKSELSYDLNTSVIGNNGSKQSQNKFLGSQINKAISL